VSGRSRIQSLPWADEVGTAAEPTRDDRFEFATHLRQHQTQLFGYIYSLVRNLDDADDLFQQTSLVLWEKFAQFDAARSFIRWACGVARYEVLNFVRSHHRDRLYFSDELNLAMIEAHADLDDERLEERRDALSGCMQQLRERDLELLEACYRPSTTVPDVARAWGRSTHSVHNSLRRIRRLLFDCVRRALTREGLA
jgi:RNA polymerase sigma-70 factor (ECF subfamily)